MSILSDVLFILLIGLFFYSAAEYHSFSPAPWRRGLTLFRHAVEGLVPLDSSIVGREIAAEGVIAKLIDEKTCLFRREPRWFELRSSPLLGEIRFGQQGYLVLGRMPYSQVLAAVIFVGAFSTRLAGFEGASGTTYSLPPIALALLVFVASASALSIVVERDRMRRTYLGAVAIVQMRS